MTIKSSGRLKRISKDFGELRKRIVDVGIVEDIIYRKKGRNVHAAMVYAVQEEGSRKNNVPKRPTLRPAAENAKYTPRVKNLLGNIAAGNGYMIGLNKIGEVVTLKAKSNVQGIKQPPLKPATIRQRVNKGSTNPLVDEGKLKKAIAHKVNKK